MIEKDTVRLLRECDAGIQMGVDSLNTVLPHVKSQQLKDLLTDSKERHLELDRELRILLDRYGDEGKDPNPMLQGMSKLKTEFKLNIRPTDAAIADLITEGCHMGVKSLYRYLNQYQAADEESKTITKKIASLEEELLQHLRPYL